MSSFNVDNVNDYAAVTYNGILSTDFTVSDGMTMTSTLDLNSIIGNNNGVFSWGGINFTRGARNVHITRSTTGGYLLEADLPDSTGKLTHSVLSIGSTTTTFNRQPAFKHGFGIAYSDAHAIAGSNTEADDAVLGRARAIDGSSSIGAVLTYAGAAGQYWPGVNVPVAGSAQSATAAVPGRIRFVVAVWELCTPR